MRTQTQRAVNKSIHPNTDRRFTSGLFASFFLTSAFFIAIGLTGFGGLLSLSDNIERISFAYSVLRLNLILIILIGFVLLWRLKNVFLSRKNHHSLPLLHRRFVIIFSLATLIPALTVAIFSTSLVSRNINDLFGENVRGNLEQARNILDDYYLQELGDFTQTVNATGQFLSSNQRFIDDRISYTAYLHREARLRNLDAAYVIKGDGTVLTRVESANVPEFKIPVSTILQYVAETGETVYQPIEDIDYLIALTKLSGYEDTYLSVGQFLRSNRGVLSSISGIRTADEALSSYNQTQDMVRKTFYLTLLETGLLILYTGIAMGIAIANRVVSPLGRLIDAAERIRSGDLSARVNTSDYWGEMSDLGSAFNRMSLKLNSQRQELLLEHNISEERRQFSEAVLSGVRAGVIGLNQDGRVTLINNSAETLLEATRLDMLDQPLGKNLKAFEPAFQRARENFYGHAEDQINIETPNGVRNLDVRVSAYQGSNDDVGWVITFDDMTRLVAAQRHSAWREVARRIAHEIKNPLTPIQLSAERLQRKYKSEITKDPDVFENCTNIIIRQVNSLEKMVNAFSTFARSPTLVFSDIDMSTLIKQTCFALGVSFPDIEFIFNDETNGHSHLVCDERLMGQALTNILKNAAESVTQRVDNQGLDESDGQVILTLKSSKAILNICISDNGVGWPMRDTERLFEPYVTTRDEGTGLGLAIVRRIIEDHKGRIALTSRPDEKSGAFISIGLPVSTEGQGAAPSTSVASVL